MRANNLSDIKQANRHLLYNCIYENKSVTMTDLEHLTTLSRPTVAGLVRDMEAEGEIVRAGMRQSQGGRAPMMYKINPQACVSIGVDLQYPEISVTVCDLEYNMLEYSRQVLREGADKEQTLAAMEAQIERAIQKCGIDRDKYVGMGIGIPGVIDIDAGVSVIIEKIPGWEQVEVARRFSERFHMPVYVQNDVNLLTVAERRLWCQESMRDMLCIVIRSGIGMGILVNDRLYNGAKGNSGRIGHFSVNFDGPECECGSHGCLTQYSSVRAICRNYQKATGIRAECGEIVRLAKEGDDAAQRVINQAGYNLGLAVISLVNLFDVENVVVLTGFEGDMLLQSAQRSLDMRSELFRKRPIHLFSGRLQEDMYAMGGCMLAMEKHRRGPRLNTGASSARARA